MGVLQPSGDLPIVLFFLSSCERVRDASWFHPSPSLLPCWRFFSLSSSVVVQGRFSPQRASARASSPRGGVTPPRSLHANLPNDGIPKPTCHTCAPLGPSAVEIGNLRFLLADVARAKRWSRFVSRGKEKAGSTQKRKITPSG